MKFYFDGCSFTAGGGLKKNGYDPSEYRWSKLVCDHFGAEEYNWANSGVSNDQILRHLFTGQVYEEDRSKVEDIRFDLNDFDFFFIQITFPSRFEYFKEMKQRWQPIKSNSLSRMLQNNDRLREWVDYYYKEIYSDRQCDVKEIVTVKSIESQLKLLNKPYLITTVIRKPVMTYDIEINKRDIHGKFLKYDRLPCQHPSPSGHRQLADDIIEKVENEYY